MPSSSPSYLSGLSNMSDMSSMSSIPGLPSADTIMRGMKQMQAQKMKGGAGRGESGKKLRGGGGGGDEIVNIVLGVVLILLFFLVLGGIGMACWNGVPMVDPTKIIVVKEPAVTPAIPITPDADTPVTPVTPDVKTSISNGGGNQRAAFRAGGVGPRPGVAKLAAEHEAKALLASAAPSIVFVYSEGCGYCKKAAPVFEELSAEYPSIKFGSLNARSAANLARENNITGYPTFLTNFGSSRKHVGFQPKEAMKVILNGARGSAPSALSAHHRARIVVSPVPVVPSARVRGGAESGGANAGAGPMEVDEATATSALAATDPKVIVFVYTDWCGFCKKMKPIFAEIAQSGMYAGKVQMMTLNGEKAPTLTAANKITGFPTFLMNFGDKKQVGFKSKEMFMNMLATAGI